MNRFTKGQMKAQIEPNTEPANRSEKSLSVSSSINEVLRTAITFFQKIR